MTKADSALPNLRPLNPVGYQILGLLLLATSGCRGEVIVAAGYSDACQEYVRDIREMIKYNDLARYDAPSQSDTPQ